MTFTREKDDFYPSPPGVGKSLFRNVWICPGQIWEPAAGDGSLARQMVSEGRSVISSDLVDRGCPEVTPRVDFLMETGLPPDCDVIITNPPYKLADEFITKALDLGAIQTVMLLPFKWAGATGPRRTALVRKVSDIVRLGRLRMLPPGATDKGHNGMVDFAWFVIRQDDQASTRLI